MKKVGFNFLYSKLITFLMMNLIIIIQSAKKNYNIEPEENNQFLGNSRINYGIEESDIYNNPSEIPKSWQRGNRIFDYLSSSTSYMIPNPINPPIYPVMGYTPQMPPNNYYYRYNPPQPFEVANQNIPLVQNLAPKVVNLRGNEYNPYPQYVEKMMVKKNKRENKFQLNNRSNEDEEENKKSINLAKELEKQIHELQKLTKEAKEAKEVNIDFNKKINTNNKNLTATIDANRLSEVTKMVNSENITKNEIHMKNDGFKFKKSNLNEIRLDKEDKIRFENNLKNLIDKLDKIKFN